MSASFSVSTKFTAIDSFSAKVDRMAKSATSFGMKASAAVARVDRQFRKLTPSLSAASKQMLTMIGTAAMISFLTIAVGGAAAAIKEYDDNLASLQAITGATNQEMVTFKSTVESVAKSTKRSFGEVAKGFEIVGSAKPELLANADALGKVTEAAIILSKASGDDLEMSALSLTGVMNQFNLAADQSTRTMNVLAAGSLAGSANITNVSGSMKNFGAVASAANISLEQSVALVEVMGSKSLFAEEAGTKLRGAVLKLQQAGVGYGSGLFDINDALTDTKKKVDSFASAKEKDAFILKTFGAMNITTGQILLSNIDKFNDLTVAVTGTTTATDQAETKSKTLTERFLVLKNTFNNMASEANDSTGSFSKFADVIGWLTENLGQVIGVIGTAIGLFIGIKSAIAIATGFIWLYNTAVGIQAALTGTASIAMAGNATAIIAMNFATKAITATTWLWNAALAANPIVWIIIAIAALIAIIILLAMNWDVVMKVMKLAWEGFKLSFTLIGLKIKNGFLNMIDAIVMAWKWGQNKMGFLSDEKFAKDKARIESEKQARIAAIKETESALVKNIAETKAAASEFSFTGSNGEETENQDGAPGEPGTPATPVNPDLARIERTEQVEKQNVNITIDDKTGKATVDADKGIPVNSTSTMVPG